MKSDHATKNFLYSEAVCSDKFPELAAKIRLPALDRYKFFIICTLILQPARDYIDQPIKITSEKCNHDLNVWMVDIYRCAVDFQVLTINDIPAVDPNNTLNCFLWMAENLKNVVGQLIFSSDTFHIHVSLPTPEHYREILVKTDGEYISYDPSEDEVPPFIHAHFARL